MARKPLELPAGVEFIGQTIRIRFTWKGQRRCETLGLPQTPKGIKAASDLRSNVITLAKLGVLDESRYSEFFPNSSYSTSSAMPTFGEYAQSWLNGRDIVLGTKNNYLSSLNNYWMPILATIPIDQITSTFLRKIVGEIPWERPAIKRSALQRLNPIFVTAMLDGLLLRNPLSSIETPAPGRKDIDPFSVEEANRIIASMYAKLPKSMKIYAALSEFAFFTGMRPGEIYALRWDDIDMSKRTAHVFKIVADQKVEFRTKTRYDRHVMLNSRAMNALAEARKVADLRATQFRRKVPNSPYVFPPSRTTEFIQDTTVTAKHFDAAVDALAIRPRPQYNCRHTYATMCLMANMNPAFIASQLGHSVRMLLSTYARWINSKDDWSEVDKLEGVLVGTNSVQDQQTIT
ncbi:tyrosine-type recombinase/integrase [Pseudomonas huanghezhanensis]|uniref:tyrosine-type recombinase/integrase n=1 Tax=Pseudomonas huanghezhanensis TaxID=3002903 RepID=UPI0022868356|nr:tyrosine-type recombinase/integrase [Pseudomonas sp. BSw22131]